jgi:hypothetical protein
MNKRRTARAILFICILLFLIALPITAAAGDETVSGDNEGKAQEPEDKRSGLVQALIDPIREELLEIELPEPQQRRDVDISLSPRVADLIKSNYIRSPIKVKYGLTNNIELSATPRTYLHNPFKRETLGMGMADLDLGIKYRFLRILKEHFDMAFAFHTIYPVGSNPDLMDGYVHYRPALLASKQLESYENLTVAGSLGQDIVDGASEPLVPEPNGIERKDITTVSTGFKLKSTPFAYTLEFVYTTDKPDSGEMEAFTVTPGWHYSIPKKYVSWFPGSLGISLGVRFGFMDAPDKEYITTVHADIPLHIKVNLREEKKIKVEAKELGEAYQKLKNKTLKIINGGETEKEPPDEEKPEEKIPESPRE